MKYALLLAIVLTACTKKEISVALAVNIVGTNSIGDHVVKIKDGDNNCYVITNSYDHSNAISCVKF